MLSKPQFIKKFVSSAVAKTFLYPSLSSFSHPQKSIPPFQFLSFASIPPRYYFSSFQLINNDYLDDLALLKWFPKGQLTYATQVLTQYSNSRDPKTFNSNEIQWVVSLFQHFAIAYKAQGNLSKAYSYIKEAEHFFKKANVDNTFFVANNHFIKSSLCLNLNDTTTDIEYHLNEVDRICDLLGHEPEARSLKIQNLLTRGDFHQKRDEQDKALDLFNQILEKKGQVVPEVLPTLLVPTYEFLGNIYASREDVDKAVESWTNGLKMAIPHYGENSEKVFFIYCDLSETLHQNQRPQEALPFIKNGLQVAQKIYPANHAEIAWCHCLHGHILAATGSSDKALKEYKKSIKIYEMEPQENLSALSEMYVYAADINYKLENKQEALNFSVKSLQILRNDPNIIEICLERTKELTEQGRLEEIELYLKEALDACKKAKPQDKEKTAAVNFYLGEIALLNQDWKKAFELLKESEKLFQESTTGSDSLILLDSYLAVLNALSKNYDESVKYLLKTIETCQADGDIGYHQQLYYYLGKVYHQSGKTEKAKEAEEKYKSLCKTNKQEDPYVQNGVEHAQMVFEEIENLDKQ